jgi:hypothetical protein
MTAFGLRDWNPGFRIPDPGSRIPDPGRGFRFLPS